MRAVPITLALAVVGASFFAFTRKASAALPPSTGIDVLDQPDVQAQQQEYDVLRRTIWAEARGEGYRGMQAVANVIMNRRAISAQTPTRRDWWGETVSEICLSPNQFSAWRADDPNRGQALAVTESDSEFRSASTIALQALAGTLPDITFGATHYHAVGVYPDWASGASRVASIGQHVFYASVG